MRLYRIYYSHSQRREKKMMAELLKVAMQDSSATLTRKMIQTQMFIDACEADDLMAEDKDLMVSLKAAKMTIENAINYIDNAADIMDWYIALDNGVLD